MSNRWALVKDNVVENIIIWDGAQDIGLSDDYLKLAVGDEEYCNIGCTYAPSDTPRFIAPPPIPPVMVFTSYEFLLRFTAAERAVIRNTAKTDDGVADFLMLAEAAQEIHTDDPMTLQGMDYIVGLGIISELRKNQILGLAV